MENLPIPLSRVELYLAKACGMDVTVPEAPESRLEQYLAILAGDTSVEMPAPMSLTEQWLAYVLGVTPDPLLAVEGACYIDNQKVDVRYFAVAAGMPGAVLPPAPQNRKEQYWANIQGGGGGVLKYATGIDIALTDVVRGIEELQYVYGDTLQNGTPTPDAPIPVQTVTGEQTVTIDDGINTHSYPIDLVSKNLMNYSTYDVADGRIMNMPDLVLPIGTFTISFDLESFTLGTSNNTSVFLYLVDENGDSAFSDGAGNKTIISINSSTQTGRYSYTFETKAITHKNNTNFRIGASEYENGARCKLTNIQIESGSTPTAYVSYFTPIELCKIGDYQDYIYKSGDDWYLHKECGKEVFNGSGQSLNYTNGVCYSNIDSKAYVDTEVLSNYFAFGGKATNTSDAYSKGNYKITVNTSSTKTRFYMRDDSLTTLSAWQTWLSSHNTIVYYSLETPTNTKITDNTLIGQLNAVNNATLPTPVANIYVTTDGTSLPGPLKISYYGEEE